MTLSKRPAASPAAPAARPLHRLPITSEEVLAGLSPARTLALERAHGNTDLMRTLSALGIAGPFRRVSPWELEDEKGRHLVHAGGYAALPFGDGPTQLVDFALRYLQGLDRGSLPQQAASDWRAALETNLVALLASVAPSHARSRVVFSNSGAEAIEVALKLVRGSRPGSSTLVTFSGGYHGKTLGALSVTPNDEYQAPFRPLLSDVRVLPYGDADAVEREILALGPDRIAAIVLEPVQGESGVVHPPEGFLAAIERLRARHGVPVVADEIQTGLGRSGHWFASVAGGLDPDVVTLAKPLSGGLVPIGATIARPALLDPVFAGFTARRHSSTFAGNGLAMAVGVRALELLVEGGYDAHARRRGEEGLEALRAIAERHPGYVREVRGAGMLYAMVLRHTVRPTLVPRRGQLARLFGSALAVAALHEGGVHACFSLSANGIVRLTPALDMPDAIFEELWARVERVAAKHHRAWTMLPRAGVGRLARLARLAARGVPRG